MRPGGTEVSASPLWQATPRLDIGYGQTLYRYITAIPHQENMHYYAVIQGVSENMQQLLISTKIGCKPGRITVIYQIQAYNHTILFIIKNPETDTK